MKDINSINPYEFENLICSLFQKMGFDVEHTSLSGDGGIDVIAYYHKMIFKGKYIIQCKRYAGSVGEPYIRDLYGVTVSEHANKGILITTSAFTQKAIRFSKDKNIELIDGMQLKALLNQYGFSESALGDRSAECNYFYNLDGFDKMKYETLSELTSKYKNDITYHVTLFSYLYSFVVQRRFDMIDGGLVATCIEKLNKIQEISIYSVPIYR